MNVRFEDLPLNWQTVPSMIKAGLNDVSACWASSFGVSSRSLCTDIANLYNQISSGEYSFADFMKWIVRLPAEYIVRDLNGQDFEKQNLIRQINDALSDTIYADFVFGSQGAMTSYIECLQYDLRWATAAQLRSGEILQLSRDLNLRFDAMAVRVLYQGEVIGYLERDKARALAREMRFGRQYSAKVRSVAPGIANEPLRVLIEIAQ